MAKGELPAFEYASCMACGACVPACPSGCIVLTKLGLDRYRKAYPELADRDACTGCGLCVRACPVECVVLGKPALEE